ncbi:MAG: type II secretion system GspH family protein [Methanothrix sp.]|nr:type II secretion system GspH family protein [Methanothrix sp.]
MLLSRNSQGFAYIALLVVIVVIGISLGAAGKYWSNVVLRDKEEELIFRGDQYRQAIELYYKAVLTAPQYPASIDDLLMDNRTATGKRHLRQRYKDPISGEDFVEIKDPTTNRIIGVHSPSDKQPFKQANFPPVYSRKLTPLPPRAGFPANPNDFEQKGSYSDWLFVSTIIPAPPGQVPGPRFDQVKPLIPPRFRSPSPQNQGN